MAAASAAAAAATPVHQPYMLERSYKFGVEGDMTALLLFSCITFFQQVGFASLESGSVRAKNTRNVLLKTLIDKLVSGIVYWAFGFAFAYGDTAAGGLIGRSYFFLADRLGAAGGAAGAVAPADGGSGSPQARAAAVLALWFSSWVFLITATTIVSGCLAERARFEAYLAYTPVMAGLAFPLAVHWAFHGWLSDAPCSYIDFAGGSTVHLLGGAAGLAASLAVGPRLGRFAAAASGGSGGSGRDAERGGGGSRGRSSSHNGNNNSGSVVELGRVAEDGEAAAAAASSGAPALLAASSSPAPPPSSSASVASGSSSSSPPAAAAQNSSSSSNTRRSAAATAVASLWNRNGSSGGGNGHGTVGSGRRQKREQKQRDRNRKRQPPIPGHNVESVTLGTLMLWFGWYGFNVAPSYLRGGARLSDRTAVAVRAAVNTTLCACASGLSALGLDCCRLFPSSSSSSSSSSDPGKGGGGGGGGGAIDLRTACNGVLGGIVAATALCAYIEPWAAVAVGALGGAALVLSARVLERLGVDDPLDSVSVHGSCALVGLLGAAFLARPELLEAYRGEDLNRECGGLFYLGFRGSRGWTQLGVQLAGAAAVSALSFSLSALVFFGMRAAGVLRVDTATEIAGIDHVDHGGPAYPDFELKTRE